MFDWLHGIENISLWDSSHKLYSSHNEKYVKSVEFIGKHALEMKEHFWKIMVKEVLHYYLGKNIENKIIPILRSMIQKEIIPVLKSAVFFYYTWLDQRHQ